MADKMLGRPAQTASSIRGRFITPRQPAGKAVGAPRYSRFVTCYPWPSGCLALVAPGPSGSTKKAVRALAIETSTLERLPNAQCRTQNVESRVSSPEAAAA